MVSKLVLFLCKGVNFTMKELCLGLGRTHLCKSPDKENFVHLANHWRLVLEQWLGKIV